MNKYNVAVLKIIEEQQQIIGPLAMDLARRTAGILVVSDHEISISGDPKQALEGLVLQYQKICGRASVEASKDALRRSQAALLPDDIPTILR